MPLKPQNRQPLLPILMVAGGVLLILTSVAWIMMANTPPQAPSASLPAGQVSQTLPPTRVPYPGIQRVSVGDAKAALELKQAILIDVRGEPYFSAGHIPGAYSFTEDEMLSRMSELDPSAWIITYCT